MEPVGEYRRDYRIAALTSMVYNVASSFGGKRRHVAKPEDFMVWLDKKPAVQKEQSVDEMKQIVTSFAASAEKAGLGKKPAKKIGFGKKLAKKVGLGKKNV